MATATIAREVAKRKAQAEPVTLVTFAGDLERELRQLVVRTTTVRFPNPKYQRDPVGFFREVLGVEPWQRQIEMLEAIRDHRRTAFCSGHKIGKSTTVAGIALWFYCSFEDARAVMSSTTSRQVDQILWRELRMIRARSGRCVACKREDPEGLRIARPCPHSAIIEGEQGELARTGLKSDDFREIVGFTARESEAIAGISGRNLIFLMDEASGIPDQIYEAIAGNTAGGARTVLVGNGTRNEGEFFEAFNSKAHLYRTLRISSEETPNARTGENIVPGLATRDWIEEKRQEWGETSPLYKVRVKGEHATNEETKIFSLHTIGISEMRWAETSDAGRLFIGIDPAGDSGTGDETVFVARRGLKMLLIRALKGLSADAHVVHLLALLQPPLRLRGERPVVCVDRGGDIGIDLVRALRVYVEDHPDAFDLVAVQPNAESPRRPEVYPTVRDALAANLVLWFKEGGAIIEDVKLEKELHALEWLIDVKGRQKLIPKDRLRKILGRSPDRYDALALACWEPQSLTEPVTPQPTAAPPAEHYQAPLLDPYAGADLWQR